MLISLVIMLTQFLHGWSGETTQNVQQSIVIGIETMGTYEGSIWQKSFADPEKLEAVLHCLRRLQPSEPVDIDPESFRTDSCQITLMYADGSCTVYRQLHTQFLQIDGGAFCPIREGAATQLIQLLYFLESDGGDAS